MESSIAVFLLRWPASELPPTTHLTRWPASRSDQPLASSALPAGASPSRPGSLTRSLSPSLPLSRGLLVSRTVCLSVCAYFFPRAPALCMSAQFSQVN